MKPEEVHQLKIVYRSPTELIAFDRNSRTHTPAQIDLIRASIREFGFTNPILLMGDNKTIGAGHARCLAAMGECLEKVPTITLGDLSDEQWRAYVIADNQLQITGSGWDEKLLAEEMAALSSANFDLSLLGFDITEVDRLLGKRDGATDPEDVPPVPETPVSRLKDVWIIGDHRIICGSSTDPEDVAAVLSGVKPHLMVTDPPYGVEYDPNWRNEADRANGKAYGARAVGKVENDNRADWSEAWALFPGDVAYVWCAPGPLNCAVHDSLVAAGFPPRMQIVWAKNQLVIGRGHYHAQHENLWYAVRKKAGATGHWQGDRKQSTIWQIDKPQKSETGHSTQKPVECMKRPIENNSKPGDLVYEPFSGSGTTIIAGQMTGRRVLAVELNPLYVDVAVTRWEQFTEREAVLESTGQTFAEVKAERIGAA